MEPIFDHEKLDVYGVELQFMTWITDFLHDVCGSPVQHRRELIEQLDRASLSMPLNTAEGNSKRHGRHRAKFLDDARGSAFECAPAWMHRSPSNSSGRPYSARQRNARTCCSDAHVLNRSLRCGWSSSPEGLIPLQSFSLSASPYDPISASTPEALISSRSLVARSGAARNP
jgi:hypothetical protein